MTDPAAVAALGPHRVPGVTLRIDGDELDAVRGRPARRHPRAARGERAGGVRPHVRGPRRRGRRSRASSPSARRSRHPSRDSRTRSSRARSSRSSRRSRADGTLQVTARCQDAAHRLRADSQLRVFVDVSVAELARELARPPGSMSTPRTRVRACHGSYRTAGQSLDLLTSVTRRAGLWWRVDRSGGTLELFDDGGAGDDATRSSTARRSCEATVTASSLANRSGWRVMGWDPVTGDVATGSADAETAAPGASEGVLGGAMTAGGAHLDALARGLAGDDRAAGRSLRAVIEGDPAVEPGTTLVVEGLTPDASGSFVLLGADHVIDTVRRVHVHRHDDDARSPAAAAPARRGARAGGIRHHDRRGAAHRRS